ncbi:MAG TPA: hypothetical protein VNX40_02725 [Mucilaginibacter sp.]|jgi:hypothetical protein|nr:hypothetical protein [Mucilaginibacter sp.]
MKTNNSEPDWFDELTEEQQEDVFTAIAQLHRGEGIPHEEAMIRLGLFEQSSPEYSKK